MSKLLAVAALVGVLAAAGCSKAPAPAPTTVASTTSTASPSTTDPGSTGTDAPPDTSTPGGTATGTSVAVDQSTPEAAMTSWLMAMFAGDTKNVCALMSSKGKAIADVPQAVETCSSMIGSMLEQLEPLAGAFQGLTIEGATVTGDTATFEGATTQPAMAAQIIRNFSAVRIDGRWYVTQG